MTHIRAALTRGICAGASAPAPDLFVPSQRRIMPLTARFWSHCRFPIGWWLMLPSSAKALGIFPCILYVTSQWNLWRNLLGDRSKLNKKKKSSLPLSQKKMKNLNKSYKYNAYIKNYIKIFFLLYKNYIKKNLSLW